jgi:Asp/Glu/hydantoin racemase
LGVLDILQAAGLVCTMTSDGMAGLLLRPHARIALIHAVAVAIVPTHQAFIELWPEATCTNLLDDSLGPDRAHDPGLVPAMCNRIVSLAEYAVASGADGVLFTCSAFGAAIEAAAARLTRPVLKPNEAMFEAALAAGNRVGMLATFAPAVLGMEAEFRELAASSGRPDAHLKTVCVPEAMVALQAGDSNRHNSLLAAAAHQLQGYDVVMLAQFSMAQAQVSVELAIGGRVLNSPAAAVAKMLALISANYIDE